MDIIVKSTKTTLVKGYEYAYLVFILCFNAETINSDKYRDCQLKIQSLSRVMYHLGMQHKVPRNPLYSVY